MLVVDFCSADAARYACANWHYSGTVPKGKLVRVGVWEDDVFVGAVVFGDGANPGVFAPYGLDYSQGAELVRVALRAHAAPVSQIVTRAVALLRAHSPGLRILVSFADPEHGHHGGIYQAMNWLYLGTTKATEEFVVNGKRMHGKGLRQTRRGHRRGGVPAENVLEWARLVLDPNAYRIMGSSKHRYVLPLDRGIRRRLTPLALPFPRGRRLDGESSTSPVEGSGSTPDVRSKHPHP